VQYLDYDITEVLSSSPLVTSNGEPARNTELRLSSNAVNEKYDWTVYENGGTSAAAHLEIEDQLLPRIVGLSANYNF